MNNPKATVVYEGNNNDMVALVGAISTGIVLFSCLTCNLGFNCLPFIAALLGIVGLLTAEDSVDPSRTRMLSWFSISIALLLILFIGAMLAIYLSIIIIAAVQSA